MKYRLIAVGLLLSMLWLELSTESITAATPDEPMHILRGYVFVARGLDRIGSCVPCSPVLSGALIGASLSLEPGLHLPPDTDPGWQDKTAFGFQEAFLWNNSAPPLRLLFLARLPIMFVSLLLGALIFRWAAQRSGPLPAVGALTLYVFCPNFLAHARLATTDVVAAATFALSAYTFTRALDSARHRAWVISGGALGLALAAKVSAVWLPVAFTLIVALRLWPTRPARSGWRRSSGVLIGTGVVAAVTVWGLYRFTIGPLSPGGPVMPAPGFWGEWQAFNDYLKDPLPGYLLGQVAQFGWWYYFPIAFLAKTPLPILIGLLAGLFTTWRARTWLNDARLLLPAALLLTSLLFSPHALGYRYLLPLLPFIFVYLAAVIKAALRRRWAILFVGGLVVWQVIGTLRYYPYYLTFFNELVGGPDRGRYLLIDSNLDWGQDLPGLKQYADDHPLEPLRFSYAGATPPEVYGLQTQALPPVYPAMRHQGAWWLRTYYPPDPPPGVYAISVNPLMTDAYGYFRDRPPLAVVGNSIYLYEVQARGQSVDLSLAGVQIDQIDASTYRLFATNDVRPRWFEAASALIAAPGASWIALAADQALAPEFQGLFAGAAPITRTKLTDDDRTYTLYHFNLGQRLIDAAQHTPSMTDTVTFGATAALIGYEINQAGHDLTLLTFWRAGDSIVTPLQMFVHAIGPDGAIVAQADRLDAPAFGWRAGDLIAQIHRLSFEATPAAPVWLEVGLYNSDSGERVNVTVNGQAVDSRWRLPPVALR